MTYDRKRAGEGPASFGVDGTIIDLSGGDYIVPDTVKAVVVVSSGNISCRPLFAAADIPVTGAPVGMLLPWHCVVIRQTGTTATLATVIGR